MSACRQQPGEDRAADVADQDRVGGDDVGRGHDGITGGFQRDGETAAVGVGARPGLGGVDHHGAYRLVERQQRPQFLLDAGRVLAAQHPA